MPVAATAASGTTLWNTDTEYGPQEHESLRADRSENNVLMAFIKACWQWLTSPAPVATMAPSYPPKRNPFAALPAMRPRLLLLAPIHVPWRLRSSPPLA